MRPTPAHRCAAVLLIFLMAAPAHAWDAAGHRMVTRLAIEGMHSLVADGLPTFLRDPRSIEMIADQAVVPDRWRNVRSTHLTHLNNPDHYLDVEQLADYELTLRTMPPLRHEFVRVMALAREKPGYRGKPASDRLDATHVAEYPGFLPHATLEYYAKLVSAFRVIRILERLNQPERLPQLDMARCNAMVVMGLLSHYVADAAQPLHTTIHHHGWVGENPNGYTTDRDIHAYIDGGVIREQRIADANVLPRCEFKPIPDETATWDAVLDHIERSFTHVEPLYRLHKQGDFSRPAGREFIESRLADGASTLAALYARAWKESEPTARDIEDFIRYDNFERDAPRGQ
jgi:hypothetical protein